MVLPGESFEPAAVLAAVEAERFTSLYGVPTMFIAELAEPEFERYDLSSLRTGAMGGAPCPVEVMQQVARPDAHGRGHDRLRDDRDVAGLDADRGDDPLPKRVGTVGRAHPHVEVKIVDPATGQTVPRGTPGEQCTRGYSVMLGYWDDRQRPRARSTATAGCTPAISR